MQTDMFDETLAKKIHRLERWIGRLQKEMFFLKEVYHLKARSHQYQAVKAQIEQFEMFGG